MQSCSKWGFDVSELAQTIIRPLREGDCNQVLVWRNHPEIRRYMFTQHEISPEEHVRWFSKMLQDSERNLFIFEIDTTPVGFINIHKIASGGIAEWGFYVAPDAPKGTGRSLGKAVLKYAFETEALHKLCAKALAFNDRSIRFHLNLGFHREGVLRHQHFDGQQYHDVVCFGLLASEWHKAN